MSLLREIQDVAADSQVRLADLLRNAKILAACLGNADLASWIDKELNGYGHDEQLPSYRLVGPNQVVGDFSGPAGSGLRNGVIPEACVDER